MKHIFLTLLFYSLLFSFEDYDIDGVEDNVDRCLNTPFDKLVDEYGCPQDNSYFGALTFSLGSDMYIDQEYENSNNLNFFLNYTYKNWDLSISNARNSVLDNADLYVSGGYTIKSENLNTKVSLGVKNSTAQTDDYFTSINLNYFLNNKQNLFLYYNYSITGDTKYTEYENTNSLSIGSGIALGNSLYTALSYEYSSSIYPDTKDYKAISWFNNYSLFENYFASLNYSYSLNKLYYDHIVSVKLGFYFE